MFYNNLMSKNVSKVFQLSNDLSEKYGKRSLSFLMSAVVKIVDGNSKLVKTWTLPNISYFLISDPR